MSDEGRIKAWLRERHSHQLTEDDLVSMILARDDEVARLRAENATLSKALAGTTKEYVAASAEIERLRAGECLHVIPGTVIACGEDGNYCSEACHLRAEIERLRGMHKHCERCGHSWLDDGLNSGCPCAEIERLRAACSHAWSILDDAYTGMPSESWMVDALETLRKATMQEDQR